MEKLKKNKTLPPLHALPHNGQFNLKLRESFLKVQNLWVIVLTKNKTNL